MLDGVPWILICYLYLCISLCFILKSAWEPCLPVCWPLLAALFSFPDSQHAFSSDAVLIHRFRSVLKLVFAGYSYSFQRSWAYGACVISVLCVLWALSSLSFIGLFLYIDLQLPVSYIGPHLCMPHKFWLDGRKRILCCLFIGCVSLICCQSWLWPGRNWLSVLSRCACQFAGPEREDSVWGEFSCPTRLKNFSQGVLMALLSVTKLFPSSWSHMWVLGFVQLHPSYYSCSLLGIFLSCICEG